MVAALEITDSKVNSELTSTTLSALLRLARHEKWEVRNAIANNLAHAPDSVFAEISTILAEETNSLVLASLETAKRKRSSLCQPLLSLHRGLDGKLSAIERRFGIDAALATLQYAAELNSHHMRTLTHDIRTTLTSLKGASARLSAYKLSNRASADASQINHDAAFLDRLVRDMDSYSGPLELTFVPESVHSMIREAYRLASCAVSDRFENACDVEFKLLEGEDVEALVSRPHFLSALINLVQNAIESHIENGRRLGRGSVSAAIKANKQRLSISISDHGRGFELQELIEAQTIIPGHSSKPGGTGFGLPIARRNIEAHGGQISISNQHGKGALVTIEIPQ